MQAVIHIEVGEQPGNRYHQPIIQWSKQQFPEAVTFDLDNFSEPAIINYAIDLVRHVDKLFIILEATERANAGPLIKFMERLIGSKNEKEVRLLVNGKNAVLEKMGKVLGPGRFLQDKDIAEQKKILGAYFT